jgi:DNA polymerase/3'-5' exonuclease PolX
VNDKMRKSSQQKQDHSENSFIAGKLDLVADLLEQQNAMFFRVRAYRDAADFLRGLPEPVRDLYAREGRVGLEDLATIGPSIASAIIELLAIGDLTLVSRLREPGEPPLRGPH